MLCAFGGDLQTAIRGKAEIFESDVIYNRVFPGSLSLGHVFAVQTLGWAYDRVKQELKAKLESEGLTALQQKQLHLLDYPASKQFLICVIGGMREEIAGTKISAAQSFELKDEAITTDGKEAVEAWVKVLRSILPSIVQSLPAEEYEVVRSTEYTEAVTKRTKGVVAGADVLQESFRDLRGLLKPTRYMRRRSDTVCLRERLGSRNACLNTKPSARFNLSKFC